jgi:hypothetical protein
VKIHSTLFCALLAIFTAGAQARSAQPEKGTTVPGAAAIVGVWKGQMDGVPAITLTISDEGGSLSGAVLFYLIRRDEGKPAVSTAGIPEPLMNLRFDGQTLTFEVSHRRAHPPGTLKDPPVGFRLKLTGANKGALSNMNEASPGLEIVRSDY